MQCVCASVDEDNVYSVFIDIKYHKNIEQLIFLVREICFRLEKIFPSMMLSFSIGRIRAFLRLFRL